MPQCWAMCSDASKPTRDRQGSPLQGVATAILGRCPELGGGKEDSGTCDVRGRKGKYKSGAGREEVVDVVVVIRGASVIKSLNAFEPPSRHGPVFCHTRL